MFFLKIFLAQTKLAVNLLSKESIKVMLSEKQLLVWHYILEHEIITPKALREKLNIPTPTILQTLNKLLNMKKIERLGAGRGTRYRIVV